MKLQEPTNRESSWSQLWAGCMIIAQCFIAASVITFVTKEPWTLTSTLLMIGGGLFFVAIICQYLIYWQGARFTPPGTYWSFIGSVLVFAGGFKHQVMGAGVGVLLVLIGLIVFTIAYWKASQNP